MLAALYSLTICEFGRSGISVPTYLEMLNAAVGADYTVEGFLGAGQAIWDMIRLFNVREGWTQDKAGIPQRFREELPSGVMKGHKFTVGSVKALLDDYNVQRAWSACGEVTGRTVKEHGLEGYIRPAFTWGKGR